MNIKGITNIKFFAKGKRGYVYTGKIKNTNIAIKKKNPKSKAKNRIKNEIIFLKILNLYNIGPKLLKNTNSYFVYEFQEGIYFKDVLKENNQIKTNNILKKLFKQAFVLDKLGINKEEFHRPLKNVVVKKYNIPVLIDFERCHYSDSLKNVTQLVQFMMNRKLVKRTPSLIRLLKKYKCCISKETFNNLLIKIF